MITFKSVEKVFEMAVASMMVSYNHGYDMGRRGEGYDRDEAVSDDFRAGWEAGFGKYMTSVSIH